MKNICSIDTVNAISKLAEDKTTPTVSKTSSLIEILKNSEDNPYEGTALYIFLSDKNVSPSLKQLSIDQYKSGNVSSIKDVIEGFGVNLDDAIKMLFGNIYTDFNTFYSSVSDSLSPNSSIDIEINDDLSSLFGISSDNIVEEEKSIEVQRTEAIVESIDNSSSRLMKKKYSRIKETENLADSSYDNWSIFLNTYFNGMISIGIEFTEYVKNEVYKKLIDFSEDGEGFVVDINPVMNSLKDDILQDKIIKKNEVSYNYTDEEGDNINLKDQLLSDELLKDRYFVDVFHNDFDFILKNVIKIISRTNTAEANSHNIVKGFFDSLGNALDVTYLNTQVLSEHAGIIYLDEDGTYNVEENSEYTIISIESDTVDFLNSKGLEGDSFYYVVNDDTYYYITSDGDILNVTAPSIYGVNTANKRNFSSIDSFVNPLEQGTAFINNFVNLLRFVKLDSNNEFVYGGRMALSDFYSISPYFVDVKADVSSILNKLDELSNSNNKKIKETALSLKAHIFSDSYETIGGNEIYSLTSKGGDINFNIVNALASSLVSKQHRKYIESKNNKVILTKELTLDNNEYLIDDGFAVFFTEGGYTKQEIVNHLKIKDDNISLFKSTSLEGESISLEEIDSVEVALEYANIINLGGFFSSLYTYLSENSSHETEIKDNFLFYFDSLVKVAAANIKLKKKNGRYDYEVPKHYITNNDFVYVKPTQLLGERAALLINMFTPELLGNINVGGSKRSATDVPDRNSQIFYQIGKYKKANNKNATVINTHNPLFNSTEVSGIPAVDFEGNYTKVPMSKGNEVLGVSEWGLGTRFEFEITNGFILGPSKNKKLGKEFMIQPLGFSDKSNPQLMDMTTKNDFDIFASSSTNEEILEDAYVNYHRERYMYTQRIMISEFATFIGGNYNSIRAMLIDSGASKTRTDAFSRLRILLVNKKYEGKVDMTKSVNNLLHIIKLHKDIFKFGSTKLEEKVDFITLGGNNNIYLKPHMGVRAEVFAKKGKEELENNFQIFKDLLNKEKVDLKRIQKAYKIENDKDKKSRVASIDNILRRIYMANSIYGHSIKSLIMGDESIFPGKYKANDIKKYYADIKSGKTNGLEEVDAMIKGQFKRAQSNLTSGTRYLQRDTYEGIKDDYNQNNIVVFLEMLENEDGSNSYLFPKLEGKTFYELYALGVINRFKDGSFVHVDASTGEYSVNVRSGNTDITFVSDMTMESNSYEQGLLNLFEKSLEISETGIKEVAKIGEALIDYVREDELEVEDLKYLMNDIDPNVVLPDSMPSFLVTDPVSYVNILSQFDFEQENSDGVQYIHPLLYLIFDKARGEYFGGFHTENSEALKMITNSFDYRRQRQQLQKKSGQNQFSFIQMARIGSVELYNSFKKMNTSVDFRRPFMEVLDSDGNTIVKEFKNLQKLMEHFDDGSSLDDSIWNKVLEVLQKYPVNMYSFVGYITFSSAQKTGNYSFNKFENIFHVGENSEKVNLYNTKHEFNYEVLSKAHGYDISSESALALLSQLVSSISLGEATSEESFNIQNAMFSLGKIHREVLAKDFAKIARSLQQDSGNQAYNSIIQRLEDGDIYTKGFSENQIELYGNVVKEGLRSLATLAFNEEADSEFMLDVIKDSKYSLDTPSVQRSVVNTIRAGLNKETIKMGMNGFIAVATGSYKTAKVFSFKNERLSREAYIYAVLWDTAPDNTSKITMTGEEVKESTIFKNYILPFDFVMVSDSTGRYLARFGKVNLNNPGINITGVITPDVNKKDTLDTHTDFLNLDNNSLVTIEDADGNKKVYFTWYVAENKTENEIAALIASDSLQIYSSDENSLQWYKYYKVDEEGNRVYIEDTDAYRTLYRLQLSENVSKKRLMEAKSNLKIELARKSINGDFIWTTIPAEVILPTYMRNGFGIPKNTALYKILGTVNGNKEAAAYRYFKNNINKNNYKFVTERNRRVFLLTKYGNLKTLTGKPYAKKVYDILIAGSFSTLDAGEVNAINALIGQAKEDYLKEKAASFIETLNIVAARLPGQGMQSGFAATVIDFLDTQGNAILAAVEQMVTTGGDFDVDTLSILTSSLTRDGLILPTNHFFIDGIFKEELFTKEFNKDIVNGNIELGQYITETNERIEEQIGILNSDYSIEKEKKVGLITSLEKLLIDKDKSDKLEKKLKERLLDKYDHYLLNIIKKSVFDSFTNIKAAVEINTPMVFTIMDKLKESAAALADIRDTNFTEYHGESSIYNLIAEEEALQGKDGISIYALALKVNGTIQEAKNVFDRVYKDNIDNLNSAENTTPISEAQDKEAGVFNVFYDGTNRMSLKRINKIGGYPVFIDKNMLANPKVEAYTFDIHLENPKVLIVGESFDTEGASIATQSNIAKKEGFDGIIIKGIVKKDGTIVNTIIPFNNNSIQIPEKVAGKINPFTFQHSISYNDPKNPGINKTISRTSYAELDENTIKSFIANSEFNNILKDSFDTKLTKGNKDILLEGVDDLLTAHIKRSDRNINYNSIVKEIFNIEINILETDPVKYVKEFKKYLNKNTSALLNSYFYMISKDTMSEVQAQFLSSAVDNAKELILSKINANNFTNPIIVTMMVLGYSPETIIEFLHDPKMNKVIDHFKNKKVNFENSFLSASAVEKIPGLNSTSPFMKSLISLLEVNSEMSNMLSVRSLNENFKIEQFKLDKIKDRIESTSLYEASISDDITKIVLPKKANKSKNILNPEMILFLHPQTRMLHLNVHEVENSIMPAISKTVNALDKITGRSKTENSYRKANTYFSKMKVDMFLKAKEYTGKVINSDGSEQLLKLGDTKAREHFIKGFKNYFLKSVREITWVSGEDNVLFDYFGSIGSYDSEFSIIYIPLLNHVNKDQVEVGMIKEAIQELKTLSGDKALDDLKVELYKNLMIYSLIVNSGENKKNSMVEMFPEISLELSEYLNTLTVEDYDKMIPKNTYLREYIIGNLNTRKEELEKKTAKRKRASANSRRNSEENDFRENVIPDTDVNTEFLERKDIEYSAEDIENIGKRRKGKKIIWDEAETIDNNLIDVIYKSDYLYNVVFLGVDIHLPAFRLFPSGPSEAIINSSVAKEFSFLNIDSSLLSDLSLAGLQIGLNSSYSGKSIVLGLLDGDSNFNGVILDTYLVYKNKGLYKVPGLTIMKEDPNIMLLKNNISLVDASNRKERDIIDKKIEGFGDIISGLESPLLVDNFKLDPALSYLIDDKMSLTLFEKESRSDITLINPLKTSVIKSSSTVYDDAFGELLSNKEIKINDLSFSSYVISHLKAENFKGVLSFDTIKQINFVNKQMNTILNNLDVGHTVEFKGAINFTNIEDTSDYSSYNLGGAYVIGTMLKKEFNLKNLSSGIYKAGNFTVKIENNLNDSIGVRTSTFSITKNSLQKEYTVVYKDVEQEVAVKHDGPIMSVQNPKSIKDRGVLYSLLDAGSINNINFYRSSLDPNFRTGDLSNIKDIMVIKSKGKNIVVLKENDKDLGAIYYTLRQGRKGQIATKSKDQQFIYVNSDTYMKINGIIDNDIKEGNLTFIKNKC